MEVKCRSRGGHTVILTRHTGDAEHMGVADVELVHQ